MAGRIASRFALPAVPPALSGLPSTSVWLEFTPLAELTTPRSVNLGQGFPDWTPPEFLTDAVPSATASPALHQYARSAGHLPLTQAISRHYSAKLKPPRPPWSQQEQQNYHVAIPDPSPQVPAAINPKSEVLVTCGASHALSLAISALAGPGDDVVLIEPAFDIYTGAVLTSGANPVYVAMKPRLSGSPPKTSADFVIDMDELAAAITDKTKLLVLNSPHNPTGKVFSAEEMQNIAQIVELHPHCAVVSDEVYEHLTYNESLPHIPFASLSPSMFDRTVSVYSAGKTFSATGWKIGWAIGPAEIVKRMHALHQYSVFSLASTLQDAVATALDRAREPYRGFGTYYEWLTAMYKTKRDYFVRALREAPRLDPVIPDGAFYVMARHAGATSATDEESSMNKSSAEGPQLPPEIKRFVAEGQLCIDTDTASRKDYNFCRRLAIDRQVVSIPPSAFFCKEHAHTDLASNYARFAFSKQDHILEESRKRLCHREAPKAEDL